MINICLYFQLHQPYRLNLFRMQDVGKNLPYFNTLKNQEIFLRIANNCYYPSLLLLDKLLNQHKNFSLSFSVSGTWLTQCQEFSPKLLVLLKKVIANPQVELLCETSHHSLASLCDIDEFATQIEQHKQTLENIFNKSITGFRNTELIYSDKIGKIVHNLQFTSCLIEGWEHLESSPDYLQTIFTHPQVPLILLPRHYLRSDDIAFRFSNKNSSIYPLTAEKYIALLHNNYNKEYNFTGIFMDFETLGEHQNKDTGIFNFLENFISQALLLSNIEFHTPTSIIKNIIPNSLPPFSIPTPLSWADTERNVSAWLGNNLQKQSLQQLFLLRDLVYNTANNEIIDTWKKLQNSDHFYYMSQKCDSDGEVHGYFSPYSSPLDAYINFQNILEDFSQCLKNQLG